MAAAGGAGLTGSAGAIGRLGAGGGSGLARTRGAAVSVLSSFLAPRSEEGSPVGTDLRPVSEARWIGAEMLPFKRICASSTLQVFAWVVAIQAETATNPINILELKGYLL